MNREIVELNARKKFNGDLLNIVLKQIEDYYELDNSDYSINNNYKIGDQVILNKDKLLHGIGNHMDLIDIFFERGIVSPDFFEEETSHAFCFESAFWSVDREISLKDYIKNYSGMVVNYNNIYKQIPYGELDNFVENMKSVEHWKWSAESSMEIRFMPSLAKDINQIGFIINTQNEIAKRIKSNSIFKNTFKKEYAFEFINKDYQEKFKKDGFSEDYFERADYIIFGFPKNCIEGVLVGRTLEKNIKMLDYIKMHLPNCYICNIDGIIIN